MTSTIDFSGSWVVDKARSATTLEPILQLMGLPWLAIQLVLRLDVTTDIEHQPQGLLVRTTDRTSLGVLSANELRSDGVQVARVGKDGRTALLTCSVSGTLPPEFEGRALAGAEGSAAPPLAYLRITTVLPDGEGVSDNAWEMRGGGRVMQAFTTFTKAGRVARASRVLVNKAWQPGRVPVALPAPAAAAQAAAQAEAPGVPEPDGAQAAAAAAAAAAPAAAPAAEGEKKVEEEAGVAFPLPYPSSGAAAGGAPPDPFFVPLAGAWVEADKGKSAPLGLVGQALHLNLAGLAAALGGSSGSSSSSSSSALAAGALLLSHAPATPAQPCSHFTLALPAALRAWLLGAGVEPLSLPLHGTWQPWQRCLVRAVHAEGQGDMGPAWLGHELGALPACLAAVPGDVDARLPYFSCAEFDARLYAVSEVRIEFLVPEGGASSSSSSSSSSAGPLPRGSIHTLIARGEGAGKVLWLGATAAGVAFSGGAVKPWERTYPPHLRWSALVPEPQPQQQQLRAEALERARLGGVRAVLLQRRALADRERRVAFLASSAGATA